MFVRCHRDRPIRQFLPSRSFVDPFPVGFFPSYADLFVSDWIHVGIRLIVLSVRFRSVVTHFGSIVSFRTRLVFLSHPCRSFRLRSCGLDPPSASPFAFRILTSTLLGPAASCRWCLPSSSLACCDPSMMEAPHCALANDVKDERLETSSFSGGILPCSFGTGSNQTRSNPNRNRTPFGQVPKGTSVLSIGREKEWIPTPRCGKDPANANPTWQGDNDISPPSSMTKTHQTEMHMRWTSDADASDIKHVNEKTSEIVCTGDSKECHTTFCPPRHNHGHRTNHMHPS